MSGLDMTHKVIIFRPYPFRVGQKIHIDGGSRRGDWEVVGVSERKVKLRCPISHREFEWDRFCYFVEEQNGVEWPHISKEEKNVTKHKGKLQEEVVEED